MKIKNLFLAIFLVPAMLMASGGSVYTRFGLGDMQYSYSARRLGMGDMGTAVFDRDYLGAINPASWSKINSSRIEISMNYRGYGISDNNANAYYTQAGFGGVTIGIPVERELGISVVGGVTPYSRINYEVTEQKSIDDNAYKITYSGSGGLTKTFIGASYLLPYGFSLGASFDYYQGDMTYTSLLEFESTSFTSPSYDKVDKFSGPGATLGLISGNLAEYMNVSSLQDLRIGMALSMFGTMNTDTTLTSLSTVGFKTLAHNKVSSEFPMRFTVGLGAIYSKKYLFTLDYLYQPWSKFKIESKNVAGMQDVHKVGMGMEYRVGKNTESSMLDNFIFRCGLGYEQSQYKINGKGINQYSVYSGFSVPLAYENTLDVALQYGIRGTKDNNLFKENIVKLNVSLSLGELWFVRNQR